MKIEHTKDGDPFIKFSDGNMGRIINQEWIDNLMKHESYGKFVIMSDQLEKKWDKASDPVKNSVADIIFQNIKEKEELLKKELFEK